MPSENLQRTDIQRYVDAHGITDPKATQKIKGELEHTRGLALKSLHEPEVLAEAFKGGDVISSILPKYIKGELPAFNIVGAVIEGPEDFAKLTWTLRTPYMEVLKVAFLNRNRKVVHSAAISVGTINMALISPLMVLREVHRIVEKTKTSRVLLAHNHPSGIVTPSHEDIHSTNVLIEGLKVAGIELVDHVVTNGKNYSSWRNGWAVSTMETPQPQWEIVSRTELPKIEAPDTLEKIVASLRQADPNHDHVIYGDSKLQVAAVERLPTSLSVEDLAHKIARGSGREATMHVWFESVRRGQAEIQRLYTALNKIEIKLLDASTASICSLKNSGLLEPTPDVSYKVAEVHETVSKKRGFKCSL